MQFKVVHAIFGIFCTTNGRFYNLPGILSAAFTVIDVKRVCYRVHSSTACTHCYCHYYRYELIPICCAKMMFHCGINFIVCFRR